MGARRSCGQLIDTSLMTKYSYIEYMVWSRQNKTLQWKHSLNNKQFQFGINWKKKFNGVFHFEIQW